MRAIEEVVQEAMDEVKDLFSEDEPGTTYRIDNRVTGTTTWVRKKEGSINMYQLYWTEDSEPCFDEVHHTYVGDHRQANDDDVTITEVPPDEHPLYNE